MFYQSYTEREKQIVCKPLFEMAPCQVQPIIFHSNKNATRTIRPVRPTGGVRRNLFGPPDQNEMARNFDIENARQLKRLNNYKIIGEIKPDNNSSSNERALPALIAKEVADEACKKRAETENAKPETKLSGDDLDAPSMRQKLIEKTPTLHTVRASSKSISETARYKPYTTQTLITDVMPKRKAIPPP
ncbi:uncharacterized protein LOC105213307 [Zeugodacus cucurbitae]|uniref:uncharacterized protein LOC105213307 n=1 Tax=Zeugodacus cucurbitae TaxID=28588 RepID=UPI0023D94602|nr:uncharacterized protein LOC105213307 [Zeugodacus cucurbitae]